MTKQEKNYRQNIPHLIGMLMGNADAALIFGDNMERMRRNRQLLRFGWAARYADHFCYAEYVVHVVDAKVKCITEGLLVRAMLTHYEDGIYVYVNEVYEDGAHGRPIATIGPMQDVKFCEEAISYLNSTSDVDYDDLRFAKIISGDY